MAVFTKRQPFFVSYLKLFVTPSLRGYAVSEESRGKNSVCIILNTIAECCDIILHHPKNWVSIMSFFVVLRVRVDIVEHSPRASSELFIVLFLLFKIGF